MRALRRLVRLVVAAVLLAVLAVALPPTSVRESPVSLVRLPSAQAVDAGDDVVWVLFLGSDARPGEDLLRTRADAIQMVGINLRTHTSAVIGIPRDSYVDIPGFGRDKINASMSDGGPTLMAQSVGNLLGLRPDYVLTTGFDGFRAMVQSIGGVTVDSNFAFSDPVRPEGYRVGPNRLNGFQALIFARIRKAFPRGDFDRSANQQDVLRGILRQVRARADEPGFMERALLSVIGQMDTDLTPGELYRLAQAATTLDPTRMRGCVVLGGLGYVGAVSVVFPDVAQARRIADDVRRDATLDRGC